LGDHRAEIRDEPDKPDEDTKPVETDDHLFIFPNQHERRPDGVDEHQDNGQQAGDPVNVKAHTTYEIEHHPSPPGIADKSQPEEGGMPDFESALQTFTPNANGIKQQG